MERTEFISHQNVLHICMCTHLNFGLASSSVQKEHEILKDNRKLCKKDKMFPFLVQALD